VDGRGQTLHGDARTEGLHCGKAGGGKVERGSAVNSAGGRRLRRYYPRLSELGMGRVRAMPVVAAAGEDHGFKWRALAFGTGRKDLIVPEFIAWGEAAF
jgi:3'(2'), 5'-bisphosphate nucleotidase